MHKSLDYVSDYELESACKDALAFFLHLYLLFYGQKGKGVYSC